MEGEALGNRTGRCPTCAAAVEPDWLTCRSCGAILAAVRRRADGAAPVATTSAPSPPRPSDPVPSAGAPAPGPEPVVAGWPSPPPPPAEPAAADDTLGPHGGHPSCCRASGRPRARTESVVLGSSGRDVARRRPRRRVPATLSGAEGGHLRRPSARYPGQRWRPHRRVRPDARGCRLLPALVADAAGHQPVRRLGLQSRQPDPRLPGRPRAALPRHPAGRPQRPGPHRLAAGPLRDLRGRDLLEKLDAISVVGPGAWLFVIGGSLSLIGGLLTLLGRRPEA